MMIPFSRCAVLALLVLVRHDVMADAEPPSIWTIVNDNDPEATYSPTVESRVEGFPGGDIHTTQKVGDWASFSFVGTGVKWIGSKNVDHGTANIYIDGKLEGTVSSAAPTLQRRQDIYTKTGLPDGLHTLKIVVKTPNVQDFDAFAFDGPVPRQATMPAIEGVTLPPLQPLLNVAHRYPVGNGVAAAICGPAGQIETVFGPGYTTSDLLNHEDIFLDIDNDELPLRVDMRRAAKTGVFYGVASRGDIDVGLVDFACSGQPWLARLIVLRNTSATASHTIVVRDLVSPETGHGYSHGLALDSAGKRAGVVVQADTHIGVPAGGYNPVDKSVIIAFNDPAAGADSNGEDAMLQTSPLTLAPHAQSELTLAHYFRANHDMTDGAAIDAIRALKIDAELRKSIDAWTAWIDGVAPAYSLDRVKDPRARVLLEGALVILKTNQSQDGGVIAHTTFYKEGYIRDAAMAIRGLLAAGHTDEAKKWLIWCDHEQAIHGHLGDAMNCSVSLDDKSFIFDMGNLDVEEPGWVLLVARDYYKQTHDLDFLKSIDRTLRFCADIQLKDAAANGDKLSFNGDETEICGAVATGATGMPAGGGAATSAWSLSSVAMAAASIDFYIDYLKACGEDPAHYHNAQTNTTMDLNAQVKDLVAAMNRDFWRTDIPSIPGGFHDYALRMGDGARPRARIVNFTLMPVFFGTPYAAAEQAKDVDAIAQSFDTRTGFLQLVPGANDGMEGHDLGYLLWDLIQMGDWRKELVYHALVNGPTVDAWGSFSEAYDRDGHPNNHDLRSLETGIDVSALAKYWGLGK
jgi:hypothetical protein